MLFENTLWKKVNRCILYLLSMLNGSRSEVTRIVHLKKSIMLKRLLFISFVFAALASRGDDGQKITSKVQRVVVFLNGAQVTRTASVNIIQGTSTLTFENISPGIDAQSIQVHANGDFTILSVKNELNYLNAEAKQKNIEELQAQQKLLSDRLSIQNYLLSVNQEEENMLLKNQVVTGENASLDVLKLKQALDFQTARLTDIKKKTLTTNSAIASIEAELQKYNQQIADIERGSSKITSNILVTVSAKSALQSEFTLNYVVHNASWYPTYDIRAKNVNSPISISYKANVTQQSGEDWKNIKLTLSTGNPSVSGSKPELSPYYLNFGMTYSNQADKITSITGRVTANNDGTAIPGVTVKVKGSSIGTVTNTDGQYSIQVPDGNQTLTFSSIGYQTRQMQANSSTINVGLGESSNQLAEVVVTGYGIKREAKSMGYATQELEGRVVGLATADIPQVNRVENQTNVEFAIDNPYSIPSDGKQYTVEINQIDVPASYQYAVAPKLSTDVFLSAKLTDWNKYNFLSGEANLFFEGTFIGKSLLNTNATADTLNISLGADKNIVVTRTLQKELTQRQTIGSNKKDTRDWIIEVKNRKNQPVNLLVEDQLPVSQNSAIEVEQQELSGGKPDAETGKISWTMALNPQDDKKLELKYQVKYPKNQSIIIE